MSCLHIGVFREGRLVDERYAPLKGSVTVGRSAKNTIWLAGAQLPEQHTLLSFDRRKPVLHIVEGMHGEIAERGMARRPLTDFAGIGGDEGQIELPDGTRGRVTFGDTTFFLQELERPKPPPKSALPAAVRTGVFSGLDKTLGRTLAAVFVAELSFFLYVNARPYIRPDPPLVQDEIERVVEVFARPKPIEAPKAPDTKGSEPKMNPEKTADTKPQGGPAQEQKVKDAISRSALIAVLGATGNAGAIANVFRGTALDTTVADALNDVSRIKIASGLDGPGHKGPSSLGGTVGIGDIDGAVGTGGGHVRLAERETIVPKIEIEKDEIAIEGGEIDRGDLGKLIHGRLSAIQGCYERELKMFPSLRGKIAVHFTITSAGTTGECSVESDNLRDDKVADCILSRIRSWRFPFKPSDDVPVTFPFVFQPGS